MLRWQRGSRISCYTIRRVSVSFPRASQAPCSQCCRRACPTFGITESHRAHIVSQSLAVIRDEMSRLLPCFLVLAVAVAVARAQHASCPDLRSCVSLGLRNLQATSGRFPLLGRRLLLERRPDAPDVVAQDAAAPGTGLVRSAARLLDTHDVRALLTDRLSLRLFKTPQGPFDISLDVDAHLTDAQGNALLFVCLFLNIAILSSPPRAELYKKRSHDPSTCTVLHTALLMPPQFLLNAHGNSKNKLLLPIQI